MLNPAVLLLVFTLAAVLVLVTFWPPHGLWWRWRRGLLATERVHLEDALKHLYDGEDTGRAGTVQSVAGSLGVSVDRAAGLLERLQEEELAEPGSSGWGLTDEGREYALRILRSHRLWERHFSDETGLHPGEWHAQAELLEHSTSAEEVDQMAARLGHPRFDPHGDPIPTADGAMPPSGAGRPLPQLEDGSVGLIVHVEDEPAVVYAQLVAEGLHPGMRVRVLETGPDRIRIVSEGDEHVLAPLMAANLTVVPEPKAEIEGPFANLATLEPGDEALVQGISPALRGVERRRMFDLGIVPGTVVSVVRRGPGGDPTAYRVRGAVLALRRDQAELIRIQPSDEGAAA